MKDHKMSHSPKSIQTRVRVPKGYPWHLLSHICDFGENLYPGMSDGLDRIIRSRSSEHLETWIDRHGLQRMNACEGLLDVRLSAIYRLLTAVVKKYPMWDPPDVRKRVSIEGFLESERLCSEYNSSRYSRLFTASGDLHRVFSNAREFIYRVIGGTLPSHYELTYGCRHGPGSTSSLRREHAFSYYKYVRWPYSVTLGALQPARDLITSDQRWIGALEDSFRNYFGVEPWKVLDQDFFWSNVLTLVPGNRITTVPKDGRKDRPIAMEPTLNVMLQLGVHEFIRKRLHRWGIHLTDQLPNRKLCYRGSLDGSYCTIDLSSASDLISLRVVEELFPPDWYGYLCSLRSPSGVLPNGDRITYSKLSSMGNGYTFAIETLIFAAISIACQIEYEGHYRRGSISVFGDDIIVPNDLYAMVSHYLQCGGFLVNSEKSFFTGRFRESCGVEFLSGFDINPVEVDRIPSTVSDLYCDRNRLHNWFRTVFGVPIPDSFDEYFLRLIPRELHLWGPESDDMFDTHLHSDAPLRYTRRTFPREGPSVYTEGWTFKVLRPVTSTRPPRDFLFGKLLADLRPYQLPNNDWEKSRPVSGSLFGIPDRESRVRYKVVTCTSPLMRGEYKLGRGCPPS